MCHERLKLSFIHTSDSSFMGYFCKGMRYIHNRNGFSNSTVLYDLHTIHMTSCTCSIAFSDTGYLRLGSILKGDPCFYETFCIFTIEHDFLLYTNLIIAMTE